MNRASLNFRWNLWAIAIGLVAALAFAAPAMAYEVSPLRVFLEPSSGKRATTISVNNTRDEELYIEVKVFRREVVRNGEQSLVQVDDAFVVFPPQRRIEPKSSQAVRIQFTGNPPEDRSEAYVVQIVEVPIEQPGFSGVRFTYNFGVAVYVDPPRAEAKISSVGAEIRDGAMHFVLRNNGAAYGFTTGHALRYSARGTETTLEPDQLAELVAMPIIPPFSEREFSIPLNGDLQGPIESLQLLDRTS